MEQKGVTIWLTGLSGAGKSTLALALAGRFTELGRKVEVFDGDEVRKNLSLELGFSKEDRDTHVRRIGYVAKLLTRHGVVVIAAVISPYREVRESNRREIGKFVEIYCRCPLDVAESRDVKGLYKRARRGEIQSFTGINDPYEEPTNPDIVVHTDVETIPESLEIIWRGLEKLSYVTPTSICT